MGLSSHRWRGSACALPALLAVGCVGPVPEVAPEAEVAAAAGVPVELVFHREGLPPDAPPDGMPAAAHAPSLGAADALVRALCTSAELQGALARVRIARADAEQARRLPNPVLEFIVRWGAGQNQLEGSFAQSLLGVLQRPRRASAADDRLRGAAAEALAVALDVAAALRTCYAEAQVEELRVEQLQRRLAIGERLVAIADSRLAHGEGSAAERAAALAARLAVEQELATARRHRRELRLRLLRSIGEPSAAADWSLDAWAPPAAPPFDEAAWLAQALQRRPELLALRWELSALGDERALSLWAPWQDAAIGANVQRAPTWVGGPVLTVPLPVFDDGSAAAAGVDAARAEVRHRLTGAMRDAIAAVRAAYAAFDAHRADLERVQRQLLPALEQERQRALAAERLGEGDAAASLRAELAVSAAHEAALDRERDAMLALLRLERAAAGRPPSDGSAAIAAGEAP